MDDSCSPKNKPPCFGVSAAFMRKRRMAAMTLDPSLSLQINTQQHQHGVLVEEIDGLIRVYSDGHVERTKVVPYVTSQLAPDGSGISSGDIVIDKLTNVWARFYVPATAAATYHPKLPLVVYFHGGGFCVGSAAWSCYHDFLSRLAVNANCAVMSLNYRLAPENPLPAAYEDGVKVLMWLKQQSSSPSGEWCSVLRQCNMSNIFLAGDSAGANIAYNVLLRLSASNARGGEIKGMILIQPFFGGEARTYSEKYLTQPPHSALTLSASDKYWRLSLPAGATRDHPWCNPLARWSGRIDDLKGLRCLVCVSELDILKDRNLAFVEALGKAGNKVEQVVYNGVGHAFQVLSKSQISQIRTKELISHIKAFITTR